MNLKEKWTKQNNSVKVLLRKLKRHDTVVVAIAVVIAVVLCGGLIYLSTPVVAASAKDELVQVQAKDNEQTIEKLDELSEYLNGLDKTITESKDSMTSFYEKDGEKNTEKMTNTVTEKVAGLGNDMTNLHDSISRTSADVEALRELIKQGGADSDKSITDKFTNIYNNLEEIENTYNKTHENTKSLIEELENVLKSGDDKLSKELLDKYKELLDELSRSNEKLSEQNSNSIKDFKEEIGNLNTEITNKLNDISADLNKEMNNVNTSINNQFTDLNMSFQGDMTDLKTYISGEISGMNGKIDQVFQRVSNGKKLLASTLLTKNVEISEDATFAEIAKAIENIPVKIVLDKDDVPGEVVYDYHHHTDGHENACDVEYVPIENKGGCYTDPYVHTHTDECYNTTVTYTYYTTHSVEDRGFSHFTDGVTNRYYHCDYCGANWVDDNPGHHETTTSESVARRRAENFPKTNVTKTLKCDKPEGTLLGYKTACNLIEGQVVSARIVFAGDYDKYNTRTGAVNTQNISSSLMAMPKTMNLPGSLLLEDFEPAGAFEDDEELFLPEENPKQAEAQEEPIDTSSSEHEKDNNNIIEGEIKIDDRKDTGIDGTQSDQQSSNSTGSGSDSNDGNSGGDVTATEGSDNKALPIEITEDEN